MMARALPQAQHLPPDTLFAHQPDRQCWRGRHRGVIAVRECSRMLDLWPFPEFD
jgi:hypothetical protein